jgi:hypothetical protein
MADAQGGGAGFAIATDKVTGDGLSWPYWPRTAQVTYDEVAGTFGANGMSYRIGDDAA